MKKIEISIIIAALVLFVLSGFTEFTKECQALRENTLRLHILANSDSEEDQALKLKVRDKILESSEELFEPCINAKEAVNKATEKLAEIEEIAQQTVNDLGYDYKVKASLQNMYFDTRVYSESITFPAGFYNALRLEIGEGDGKNWWCVMFPPLCLPAATEEDIEFEGSEVVENYEKYKVKFIVVEWWESLTKIFKSEKEIKS